MEKEHGLSSGPQAAAIFNKAIAEHLEVVRSLEQKHDELLVGPSTSGNSPNAVAALEAARAQGLVTVAFTGAGGGRLAPLADHLFAVASRDTARIQEAHILAGHMLCDWMDRDFFLAQRTNREPAGAGETEAAPQPWRPR